MKLALTVISAAFCLCLFLTSCGEKDPASSAEIGSTQTAPEEAPEPAAEPEETTGPAPEPEEAAAGKPAPDADANALLDALDELTDTPSPEGADDPETDKQK